MLNKFYQAMEDKIVAELRQINPFVEVSLSPNFIRHTEVESISVNMLYTEGLTFALVEHDKVFDSPVIMGIGDSQSCFHTTSSYQIIDIDNIHTAHEAIMQWLRPQLKKLGLLQKTIYSLVAENLRDDNAPSEFRVSEEPNKLPTLVFVMPIAPALFKNLISKANKT